MPEPKNMLEATAEANNLASLSESKEIYMRGMEDVCGTEKPYVNEQVLEMEHWRIRGISAAVCLLSHSGPQIKKCPGKKKVVKSNISIFFREIAFLKVLNFFPVQKLIFGHF